MTKTMTLTNKLAKLVEAGNAAFQKYLDDNLRIKEYLSDEMIAKVKGEIYRISQDALSTAPDLIVDFDWDIWELIDYLGYNEVFVTLTVEYDNGKDSGDYEDIDALLSYKFPLTRK